MKVAAGPPQGSDFTATSPTSICEPIGPVPPNYGEAPTKGSPAFVSAAVKSLSSFGKATP